MTEDGAPSDPARLLDRSLSGEEEIHGQAEFLLLYRFVFFWSPGIEKEKLAR